MSDLYDKQHDAEIVRLNDRITELEARLEIAGPYDGIAARDETIRLLEARLVEQTGSHNDLVIRKSDRITELSVQLAHAEAKIDALMLEYCPDEMTPEQVENWGKHQRRVSPERTAEIDRAIALGREEK